MHASRLKILRAVGKKPHRFRIYRAVTISLSIATLALVPLLGVARFDLLGGNHLAWGAAARPAMGLFAVLAAIASFYFVTFMVNAVAGRRFCGWGCPVGQLHRLADATEVARGRLGRLRAWAMFSGVALLVVGSVALWWIDPVALASGSPLAIAILVAVFIGATATTLVFTHRFRWSFCAKACPIGLYYSVVQLSSGGVHFDHPESCTSCAVCAAVCPVHLDPRDLAQPINDVGGLAIDGLEASRHCLECGECVEACELTTQGRKPVPLRL